MAWVTKRRWTYKGESKTAWVVRYDDQAGVRRQKTFKHKKAADQYRTKIETELNAGIHTADGLTITVREAATQYLDHLEKRMKLGKKMRPSTIYGYKCAINKYIVPRLGHVKLTALKAPTVIQWIDDIETDPKSPATRFMVIRATQCLRQMIRVAQRRGQISTNVVADAKPEIAGVQKSNVIIPTKDEIKILLMKPTGFLRVIIHLAILAGMRVGEILGLRWGDVDFQTETIKIRKGLDTFGNLGPPKTPASVRDIPMSPTLVRVLKEWRLASRKTEANFVFCSINGTPLRHGDFHAHQWMPFMRKVHLTRDDRLPKYHFHALRHVAASLLIEQGESPKVIQKIMGHASITMTYDVYGHLFDEGDAGRASLAAIDSALLG